MLKPRSEWTTARTKRELVEKMSEALEEAVPGMGFSFTQPIEMRVNELIAGVRSDVGVKIYGDDLDVLREKGERDRAGGGARPRGGRREARADGGPADAPRSRVDATSCARYGITVGDVLDAVEAARAGTVVGDGLRGPAPLLARRPPRQDAAARRRTRSATIRVARPAGASHPAEATRRHHARGRAGEISRENVQRRIVVETNVRGRDMASLRGRGPASASRREVKLPDGYYIRWGGQFENLEAATDRLLVVVPLALRPHLRCCSTSPSTP